MDQFTLVHLDAWLTRRYGDRPERETARAAILAMLGEADDVSYWLDAGWPRVDEAARDFLTTPDGV